MIKNCCICGSEVTTKKILPYRDFLGLDIEIYNVHIARCDQCGFIFYQNPLTDEQLENRYKNEACNEFDSEEYIVSGEDNYARRCHRQKHFIEENIGTPIMEIGGGNILAYSKSARRRVIILACIRASGGLVSNLRR